MHLSFNLVNVCMKLVNAYQTFKHTYMHTYIKII